MKALVLAVVLVTTAAAPAQAKTKNLYHPGKQTFFAFVDTAVAAHSQPKESARTVGLLKTRTGDKTDELVLVLASTTDKQDQTWYEVRLSIRHPMETGFRVDDTGKTIPRNTLREFHCRYNGVEVFRASLGSGIAANQYLRFFVTAVDSGELTFDWIDDVGARGDARATVEIAA